MSSATMQQHAADEEPPFRQQKLGEKNREETKADISSTSSKMEGDCEGGECDVNDDDRVPPLLCSSGDCHLEQKTELENVYRNLLRTKAKSHLILISGPRGSGKTKLAQSLRHGIFLQGAFDPLRRPEPYRAYVRAFTHWMNNDINEQDKQELRKMIRETIGSEACVLTSMIPALEPLVNGESATQQTMTGNAAMKRFFYVFSMFIRALCSLNRPVVLVLDDLQWADPCSLDLLRGMITTAKNRPSLPNQAPLIVIGTCDKSVAIDSYLSKTLRGMEDKEHIKIKSIVLKDLSICGLRTFLAEMYHLDEETTTSLAQAVFHQTQGNLLHVKEFLAWLEDHAVLLQQEDGTWKWDREVQSPPPCQCDMVSDMLQSKIQNLDPRLRHGLQVAACLGATDIPIHLLDRAVQDFRPLLDQAVKNGLMVQSEQGILCSFSHQSIQEAAHGLIQDKASFHFKLGRKLWSTMNDDELEENIFAVLSQLMLGADKISLDDLQETQTIGTLCLLAGHKAATASAFRTATTYLQFGIGLVRGWGWKDNGCYELCLALHNAAAEIALCLSDYDKLDGLVCQIEEHARTFDDKLQILNTKIYAMGMRDQKQLAIDTGLEVLRHLGETFPSRHCRARLMQEMAAIKLLLKGKSDAMILRLPEVDDREKLAAMQVLFHMFLNALLVRPKFAPFVPLKIMRLTLKYGLSAYSSGALVSYGMFCVGLLGDIEAGERFGNLALELLERYKTKVYLPRVYAGVYACILVWKRPVQESVKPLLYAHQVGLETGDFEFAGLTAYLHCINSFLTGISLPALGVDLRKFWNVLTNLKQETATLYFPPFLQVVHNLMGVSEDPLALSGDVFDFGPAMAHAKATKNTSISVSLSVFKMFHGYMFGDYHMAEEASLDAMKCDSLSAPAYEKCFNLLFVALTALANMRKGIKTRKNRHLVGKILKVHRKWAEGSPENFLDKTCLIEAELASVLGKKRKAYRHYTCAIALSRDSGFLLEAALGNERAGRHFYALGEKDKASAYFLKALKIYGDWGARGKVDHLQAELELMYPDNKKLENTSESTTQREERF